MANALSRSEAFNWTSRIFDISDRLPHGIMLRLGSATGAARCIYKTMHRCFRVGGGVGEKFYNPAENGLFARHAFFCESI